MPFLGKINRMLALSASLALLLFAAPVSAQDAGTLTGVVTDVESGQPVVGAAVQVPAANRHAFTNVDGRYLLRDVPVGTQTVRVEILGYATIEQAVDVTTATTRADFELSAEALQLDALVVTGQQIERQVREVAYSVATIQGDELTEVREANFVDALAARTPGVDIISQSGDIGASTRIVIRGVSSLSGDNQPLFVVDGVPISNSNIVAGTSQDRLTGAVDVGNRGADLSADDIESVTVLRGAAAAALYGQRAKDGVILVTTKKGRSVGGHTITASTTLRTSDALVWPEFQNQYAQGTSGVYSSTSLNGWGPRIAGQEVEDINGEMVNLNAQPEQRRELLRQRAAGDPQRLGFGGERRSGLPPRRDVSGPGGPGATEQAEPDVDQRKHRLQAAAGAERASVGLLHQHREHRPRGLGEQRSRTCCCRWSTGCPARSTSMRSRTTRTSWATRRRWARSPTTRTGW